MTSRKLKHCILLGILALALSACGEESATEASESVYCAFDDMRLNGEDEASREGAYGFKYTPTDREVLQFYEDGAAKYYDPADMAGTLEDMNWDVTDDCELEVYNLSDELEFVLSDPTLGVTFPGDDTLIKVQFYREDDGKDEYLEVSEDTMSWDTSPQY